MIAIPAKSVYHKFFRKFIFFWVLLVLCLIAYKSPTSVLAKSSHSSGKVNQKFDQADTSRVIQYTQSQSQKNLSPVVSSQKHTTPTPTPDSNYSVYPVIFVASDMSVSPDIMPEVDSTFQMLRRWYSGALENNGSGYSFDVRNAQVYHAPNPFSYYQCPDHAAPCDNLDGIWGNVQTELEDAGYNLWSPGTSYVIFVKGAAGWSGSGCGPVCLTDWPHPGPASEDGVAIMGDWALEGITGNPNPDCQTVLGSACNLDPQRGAIGHELGHTFGLAHSLDQSGSIMNNWWDFPYISLASSAGNDEVGTLRNDSKFFRTVACQPDNLLNQVDYPDTVKSGQAFPMTGAFTNYGFCSWNQSSVSLNQTGDNVWGIRSVNLTKDVYPAQTVEFAFSLTAPDLRGRTSEKTYSNLWQMQDGRQAFGQTAGGQISVTR